MTGELEVLRTRVSVLNAENKQISQLQESGGSVDGNAVNRSQRCPERFLLAYAGQ